MIKRVGERTEPCFMPRHTGKVGEIYTVTDLDGAFRVRVPVVEEMPAFIIFAKFEQE